jgi:hypothetical protein
VRAERDEFTDSLFTSGTAEGTKTGAEVAWASPVSTAAGADQ